MPGFGSELARTNSDSSTLTIYGSKDSSRAHSAGFRPGTSAVWTDEKHSLYIESLETSFINQLRHSIELRGFPQQITRGPLSFWEMSASGGSNSQQLMDLHDGCWQNVKFAGKELLLESTADSHSIECNSWIHRFASSGRKINPASQYLLAKNASCTKRNCLRSSTVLCEMPKSSKSSEKHPECRQDLAGNKREVSDQNFVDGDQGDGPSCSRASKRLKTIGDDATNNDPVVKSNTKDASIGSRVCFGN